MLVSSSFAMACKASTPGSAFPCSIAEMCCRENPVCAASSVLLRPLRSLSLVMRLPSWANRTFSAIRYIIGAGVQFVRKVYLTAMKAETYNALAGLNRGFDTLLESMKIMHEQGVVSADYVQRQTEIAEEFRAAVNSFVLNKLERRENDDREHFGKMRKTTETQLAQQHPES